MFAGKKALKKSVMGIQTDSTPVEEAKDTDTAVFQLWNLFATPSEREDMVERAQAGGLGYGDLKRALFEHYWEYFAEARAKRAELESNLDHVNEVLMDGADKARTRATIVLDRARKNCGLV